jgi:hypothetical protein
MQAGVVRSFSTQRKVRTGIHVIWTNDALADGRPDGMTRRPNGWQGTEFSNLQTVQNLLATLLNSEILVKEHHYKEVILSNRMQPITN